MKKRALLLSLLLFVLFQGSEVRAVETIPSFNLASLAGGSVSLSDFLGKKDMVLNFWASWCDACKEEVPVLEKLRESGGDRTVFLGINVGDSERAARRFVVKHHFTFQILLDKDKEIARRFQVVGVPQTIVISREGKIIYRGSRPPADLRNLR